MYEIMNRDSVNQKKDVKATIEIIMIPLKVVVYWVSWWSKSMYRLSRNITGW